jgi:hypothetical protein
MRFIALTILLAAISCSKPRNSKISIEYNCLLEPCPLVIVDNDSIYWIDQYSKKLFLKAKLNANGFENLIERVQLDTFSSSYVNNYADDGIQMNITFGDKKKETKIYISNYYIPGIDSIINEFNQYFPDSLKLEYYSDFLLKVSEDGLNKNLVKIEK